MKEVFLSIVILLAGFALIHSSGCERARWPVVKVWQR
jgi:hypothetical protein